MPTKDGANAETLRGAVGRLRSGDIRMGEPAARDGAAPDGAGETGRGAPGELKHLSTPRRRNQHGRPVVAASERG